MLAIAIPAAALAAIALSCAFYAAVPLPAAVTSATFPSTPTPWLFGAAVVHEGVAPRTALVHLGDWAAKLPVVGAVVAALS